MQGTIGLSSVLTEYIMKKLMFPTNVFIGLIFNDFIDRIPSFVHTYSPYALQFEKLKEEYKLVLDENECETVYIDHLHDNARYISYNVVRESVITKLNRFIFTRLTCVVKEEKYCIFEHPSNIYIYIGKQSDGVYSYLLIRHDLK